MKVERWVETDNVGMSSPELDYRVPGQVRTYNMQPNLAEHNSLKAWGTGENCVFSSGQLHL
jgi:hypothetical protein